MSREFKWQKDKCKQCGNTFRADMLNPRGYCPRCEDFFIEAEDVKQEMEESMLEGGFNNE